MSSLTTDCKIEYKVVLYDPVRDRRLYTDRDMKYYSFDYAVEVAKEEIAAYVKQSNSYIEAKIETVVSPIYK